MADQDDRVDAVGLRLGPGALTAGSASDAGGQCYLVCDGEAVIDGRPPPSRPVVHVEPGETAPVLVLQLARPSERPGSRASQATMARNPFGFKISTQ